MRHRLLFAMGLLVFGAVSVSKADYVIIRVILNSGAGNAQTDQGQGIQPGGPRPGLPPMGPGQQPPLVPGQPPNGIMGGQGPGGVPPGGQVPRPGGFGGQGPGQPPQMPPGGPMGPRPGGPGMGPGQGPGMAPGKGSGRGPGGFFTPSAGQSNHRAALNPDDYVTVVVEIKGHKEENIKGAGKVNYMVHKWGKTAVWEDKNEVQLQHVNSTKVPTPIRQFEKERETIRNSSHHGPEKYLDLAEKCLQIGLPDKAIEVLNDVEKMTGEGKGDISPRVSKAVAAFKQVKPIINDEVIKSDKAKAWKAKLGYATFAVSKHYALVHSSDDAVRDGVQRRLDALENAYKSYYLLFAIKGKALPATTDKLVAILVDKSEDFNKQRQVFEVSDLVSDGFHARQDNLAIFSGSRVDTASRNFGEVMREVYLKNGGDLLAGKFPELGKKKEEIQEKCEEVKRAQVLALVEQALREESEIAAASHEGTAQLLAETGILARNVDAPQWLRFGLASLFEMPKGPFPTKNDSFVKTAFYPGVGGPNWAWSRCYDEMVASGTLSEIPVVETLLTVSDIYFDVAHGRPVKSFYFMLDPVFAGMRGSNKDQPDMAARTNDILTKGRTLSWALTYYLFTEKFDEFQNFLAALNALPREVELDRYVINTIFGEAFKMDFAWLTQRDATPDPKKFQFMAIDMGKLMKRQQALAVKLNVDDENDKNKGQNGPGFPGGRGGGPGMVPGGPGGPGRPGGGPGGPGRPGMAPGGPGGLQPPM